MTDEEFKNQADRLLEASVRFSAALACALLCDCASLPNAPNLSGHIDAERTAYKFDVQTGLS